MRIRRAYSIRSRGPRSHESGVAMIIALLTILIVSTLAAREACGRHPGKHWPRSEMDSLGGNDAAMLG